VGGGGTAEGSTAEGLLAAIRGAGVLLVIIGLAMMAWGLMHPGRHDADGEHEESAS
jgi:hypothetical protein